MNLDGKNYTNFPNLRVKGDGNKGPGAVRFQSTTDYEQTVQGDATYTDQDMTITLPAKSGKIALGGTFLVSFPAGNAINSVISTAVTITGLRVEDGVTATFQGSFATAGIALSGVVPTADTLTVYMTNTTGKGLTTLNVVERIVAYTVTR